MRSIFFHVFVLLLATSALAQQGPPAPEQMLRAMDTDGDNRISRQEWRGSPDRFDAIDTNRDGFIVLEELQAARRAAATGPSQTQGPGQVSAPDAAPTATLKREEACDVRRAADADPELWIDAQTHLRPGQNEAFGAALRNGLRTMVASKIVMTVVMPQPFPDEGSGGRPVFDASDFAPTARRDPCSFVFLGGNRLNQMLAQTPPDRVNEALRAKFRGEAQAVLALGAAGFGQIALLHLSRFPGHPFQQTEPDHPLMLLLAEIAGATGKPINIHMQLYARDAPPPPHFRGQNPPTIRANLAAFERLLAHDRRARFVLANFGEDPSGQFSLALARRLLAEHPNLYPIVFPQTPNPREAPSSLSPFGGNGEPARDWLALLTDFPDRFLIGSLSFHAANPNARAQQPVDISRLRGLLARMPPDLRRKIAIENPLALFGTN